MLLDVEERVRGCAQKRIERVDTSYVHRDVNESLDALLGRLGGFKGIEWMSHERQIRNSNNMRTNGTNGTKGKVCQTKKWNERIDAEPCVLVCAHRWVVCACMCVCVHWKTNDWLDGNIIEVGVAVFFVFFFYLFGK